MRLKLLVMLAWLALPAWALAKPTLAVAPIEGDKGGKIAKTVAEAAEDDADVIGPAKVGAMMKKLSIREIDGRAVKKLRKKLRAEVLIYGSVDKGKKDTLELKVSARGKKTQTIELSYKTFDAKAKKQLGRRIRKQIEDAELDASNNDEDDEDERPRRVSKRDDRRDDDDDDEDRDEDEDEDGGRRKKKRPLITQAAIRLDAGAALARRTLTYAYSTQGLGNYPPGVGTFGPAGRVEAEVYPGSFDTLKGPAANVGIVAGFEKTFSVGIDVPGTTTRSTVDQARYEIGARYRIPFGPSAIALGASYWHRHYKMSRAGLAMPDQLDAPDVAYNALSPHAVARISASKELAVFFSAGAQLMFSTGQIQESTSFGPSSVVAFEAEGGVDYMVAKNIAVHVTAELGQIKMKFKQSVGTMSAARGVASATDRIVGASASLSLLY